MQSSAFPFQSRQRISLREVFPFQMKAEIWGIPSLNSSQSERERNEPESVITKRQKWSNIWLIPRSQGGESRLTFGWERAQICLLRFWHDLEWISFACSCNYIIVPPSLLCWMVRRPNKITERDTGRIFFHIYFSLPFPKEAAIRRWKAFASDRNVGSNVILEYNISRLAREFRNGI